MKRMDPLYTTAAACLPWWHERLKHANGRPSLSILASGCATSGGNVQCAPAAMAAAASARLGYTVTLPVYTLARYIASEVGSGTVEEKVAVGEAAVNRARIEKLPHGILSLLLYRQKSGHANRGYYGPIHGTSGVSTAPYGRWAATSRDPSIGDIDVARLVLSGQSGQFARGADDQNGPEYFDNPLTKVKSSAAKRNYWVGPLPGVDHWHTFLYTYRPDIAPDSQLGQWLLARGVAALSDKQNHPNWGGLPVCAAPAGGWIAGTITFVVGSAAGFFALKAMKKRGWVGV
jgi:hypothetical protein